MIKMPTDTCTYTSGNWDINCADNCSIDSPVAIDTNSNVSVIGTGTLTLTADVTGWLDALFVGDSSTDRCEITCIGGCFV